MTVSVLLVSLAISAPLNVLTRFRAPPPQVEALSGTLTDGRARLTGGSVLIWRARWGDLIRGRITADVLLTGPETRIEGRAWAGFVGSGLSDATGRAGPELLALFPIAADCRGRATVSINEISVSRDAMRASGDIRTSDAVCRAPGQGDIAVPPLVIALDSDGNDAIARIATGPGERLGEVRVMPTRRARIRIEPAGARLIPGLPASAPMELELPF